MAQPVAQPPAHAAHLVSLAFGGLLAVVFTGTARSFASRRHRYRGAHGAGHVTIQQPDYLRHAALTRTVTDDDEAAVRLALRDRDVRRVVPRISGPIMVATASDSFGAGFIALDPALEDERTLRPPGRRRGQAVHRARDKRIVLGKTLAHNLGADVGKKVVYTLTDKHGEIVSGMARRRAASSPPARRARRGLCLLPIAAVRKVVGYGPDESTQLAIFLSRLARQRRRRAATARAAVRPARGAHWAEVQPRSGRLRRDQDRRLGGDEIFVMLLIAAGIFNTLFMSVMERLREFGILLAIGFARAAVPAGDVGEPVARARRAGRRRVVTAPLYRYLAHARHRHDAAMTAAATAEIAGADRAWSCARHLSRARAHHRRRDRRRHAARRGVPGVARRRACSPSNRSSWCEEACR